MKSATLTRSAKFILLFFLEPSLAAQAGDVKFLGGAGFKSVMPDLASQFEKTTGHKIVATWDATGGIERRIGAGEAFDVVFIGPEVVDKFTQQGKIVAG